VSPRLRRLAVSPSIGVILLVSITVAAALAAYVYLMGNMPYTSTGGVDVVEIYNVEWTAPNRVLLTLSNHGRSGKILEVAYVDGLQGYPSSPIELGPGEARDVEFTFIDDITPGSHVVKVVCRDGTMGVVSHRFVELAVATVTTSISTVTSATSTTATTTQTPCFILETYYGTGLFEGIRGIQSFRDDLMMRTHLGRIFIKIFNHAYYPVSKALTPIIRGNIAVKDTLRIFLEPLIAAVMTAIHLSLIPPVNPEQRIYLAMALGSTLAASIYIAPLAGLAARLRPKRAPRQSPARKRAARLHGGCGG